MNTTNNRNDFYKEQLDKTLNGNEKIETAIAALQKEASEEMLAHALTVIRRRMQEQAQLIIAVEPPKGDGKIFASALQEPSVEGVILNPWNRTLMLNKTLINIILGNPV